MTKDMREYQGRCVRCAETVNGIGHCPSKQNHDCLKGYYARQFRLLNIEQGPPDKTESYLFATSHDH